MSTEEGKKPPRGACAPFAILVPVALFFIYQFMFAATNFNITVSPASGSVKANGTIKQTVIVKCSFSRGLYNVALSTIDLPSGITVDFAPPLGNAEKEGYASTMVIKVDSSVKAGTYIIKIKGAGNNGKQNIKDYKLKVTD